MVNRFVEPARVAHCLIFGILLAVGSSVSAQSLTDGALRIEPITAYNLIVDSNVESPSSYSPSAAHLGVKIHNTGSVPLTNIVVNIGDLINPSASTGTPGMFPSRSVSVSGSNGYSGTFALQMPGGAADAVRVIPSLAPGESAVQYFFITYPLKDPSGKSVAGSAPDPSDDLWLNYDFWATAREGASTRRVGKTCTVTMRNEISAMANKIWPNTASKVPDEYLNSIEQSLGWRPATDSPQAGSTAQLEGVWYDLGNVGAGFDNDGDGLPDRNAWLQPVGDPSLYDPLAVRLVKCYGIIVVKLNDGTNQLIPFEDQLYFQNIPSNNTGVVGLVFYEFIPLGAGTRAQMTPYQEVASGFDNEKFNGDYGAPVGGFTSTAPSLTFDKSGPSSVTAGTSATYTLSSTNTGTTGFGFPEFSLPFVFEDSMPANLVYVAGSATAANVVPSGNSVAVSWSVDNGATWLSSEPAPSSVTRIRWTLANALAAGATATMQFQASIPTAYPSVTIDNTAVIKLGPTGELATDSVTSFVSGINSVGDQIWKDDNRNSIKDVGETGIANITVKLYYDADGDGVLDATDILFGTTQTNASGIYGFANLPDGKFLVAADDADADLPAGYSLPNSVTSMISVSLDPLRTNSSAVNDLTADWPFIGALEVVKSASPATYGAGDLITYTIDLENNSASVAAKTNPVQTSWSTTVTGNRVVQNPVNAQGTPDSVYARIDQTASADNLASSGLSFADPTGTITKVELIFNAYLSQTLVDDQLDLSVGGALFITLTKDQLNAMTGVSALRAVDITSRNVSWTWAQVQALTANLRTNKTNSGDAGILWVDSIGFRVTTVPVVVPSGSYGPSTIDPLPLVDTYDAAKIQYVSASVTPTSTSSGTITWNNLGPLNAGSRKTITVVFRALSPADTNGNGEPDSTTTLNTATSSGARFVSGRPTSSDAGAATVTINPRGSIGDLVWWDINANGVKDASEPGLANVLVSLSNGAQTRTDASGYYIFTSLLDGAYTVTVDTTTLPWSSFSQTKDPDTTVNSASGVTINNNDGLSTNNTFLDRDFGYDSTLNVINGIVFQDNDGDGIQDPGENFLVGVTVTLSGTSGATTTDSSGFYNFGSLVNGTYTVTVTKPASTIQTLDPDVTINNATTITASGGNLYANKNFAYQPSGTLVLGDSLYLDWNGDGDQDPGEGGIAGVDVFLYEDSDANGEIDPSSDALIATSVTSAGGIYGFTGLVADDYIVVVNVADPQFPAGVLQIQDYDGIRDGRAVVNLTASLAAVDFGYVPQGTGSIGDTVFIDTDGDGVKDSGEAGIASVTVTLYRDTNNNGMIDLGQDAVVGIATTVSTGTYLFSGLSAGGYLVDVDQTAVAIPSDAYGNKFRRTTTDPHQVALATGQAYLAADFGFAAAATIGDRVFFDSNGNATQDFAETGIPNVTVELYADANQDGQPDSVSPLATTVTADGSGANPVGFYQFTNLAAGNYFVKVRIATLPQVGGQPIPLTSDPDRDGVPVTDNSFPGLPAGDDGDSLAIVTLGSNYSGADFGYQPTGAIGDFVWLDLDQDGVQDAGEPGISGVSIGVTNGTATYTATTDFDGFWSIANIPDGAWTVSVSASNFSPGGALENTGATYDADGGSNSSAAIVLTTGSVNLAVGNLGLDFGYALSGSYAISGTVVAHDARVVGTADDVDDFFDDGVDQDAGPLDEIELSGVVVYLYTVGGDFLGTAVTDAGGNYRFEGLPGGGYRVVIGTNTEALLNSSFTTTAANNLAVGSVTSGATSASQTLTLATSDVADVDFAFVSNANFDFGDLPVEYGITTLAQDGGRHIIPSGGSTVYLGLVPDADTNGMPSSRAIGDDAMGTDDETGITPLSTTSWTDGTVSGGHGGSIQANVTGIGWLVGWIDWNHDGDFLDAGEFVADQAVGTGNTTIAFDIPAATIGAGAESWLSRFRIFTAEPSFPLFSYSGIATDGEVEDLLIEKTVGSSIGDFVWNDFNGNGLQNSGENGIGSVTVVLRDSANTIIATQLTGSGNFDVDGDGVVDPAGYYRFLGLAAGQYKVTVSTPPAGFSVSYDENGIGTPNVTSAVILTGEQHATTDFGYTPLLADISGQVRYDQDGDGDLNDPDAGAMVVTVQLWTDPNADGDPSDGVQVRQAYTDAGGDYLFTDVPSCNYVVVEINPPGSVGTADVDGGNPDRITVALVGVDISGRDFLNTVPPVFAVSGTVYDDGDVTNNNLIGVGDLPLASIVVKLFLDRDQNGVINPGDTEIDSVVTDSSGHFSFLGLPAGNYVVAETDPSGALSDWDADGNLTKNQIGVTITDADVENRDFLDDGYLGSISGHVYAGSAPLTDITLTLLDQNGVPVDGDPDIPGIQIISTVTDSMGYYEFTGILPGVYQVAQAQPYGYDSLGDRDGGNFDTIGDQTPITIAPGEHSQDNNFIETLDACPDDWDEWKFQHPVETADGNPDADAYDNFAEFAFDMPYDAGTGSSWLGSTAWVIQPSAQNPDIIDGIFVRPKGAPLNVTYTLQYATVPGNPTLWQSIVINPGMYSSVDNQDCTETIILHNLATLTGLTGDKGVVRIRADLDDNGGGDGDIDHTSYTEAEGWTVTDLEICCRTYNNPYQRESAFTGTVTGVSGQSLSFAANDDLGGLLSSGGSFYLEVTSGENEGHRFDVVSTSGNTATLANDASLHAAAAPFNTLAGVLPGSLLNDQIAIRRHWTLGELFPPSGFDATNDRTTADQVQLFAEGQWIIYWLYDDGVLPVRWVKTGDSNYADQSAAVLAPGQGLFVNKRQTATSILAYGEVRRNDFVRPLAAGSNLVGGGYPLDQSATSRAMVAGGGFFGSRDFATADSFFVWKADVTIGENGYSTYFLNNNAPRLPSVIKWVKVGDASLLAQDTGLLLLGNRSVFLRSKDGVAGYTTPNPWTP